MTKISSSWTAYYKTGFPIFWFGFVALFLVASVFSGPPGAPKPLFLVFPIAMAVFGFILMKKLVWDLVDEVYDKGDALIVRNRGEETTVLLSNIMNVSASTIQNPPRITLKLINPCTFGNEIVFVPIMGFRVNPFAKSQVAEDLIVRVHQAKGGRAA